MNPEQIFKDRSLLTRPRRFSCGATLSLVEPEKKYVDQRVSSQQPDLNCEHGEQIQSFVLSSLLLRAVKATEQTTPTATAMKSATTPNFITAMIPNKDQINGITR